jgi:hypothetical protein
MGPNLTSRERSWDMDPRKRQARIAGWLYLLMGVTSALEMSIPSRFLVAGDAAATAARIASGLSTYRLFLFSGLVSQLLFVFLVLALFRLLRGVHEGLATVMVALVLVQVPIYVTNTICGAAPLLLLNGAAYWSAFDKPQLDAMSMGFLGLRSYGTSAVTSLWGLWLFPLGILAYRSRFIPRVLGVFLVIGCFGWLGISVTSLLVPAYAPLANRLAVLAIGEILIILWLVTVGARSVPSEGHPSGPDVRG